MTKGRGGAKNGRTRTVTIRMRPELYEAAQRASTVMNHTVSSLTEYALRRYIEKNLPAALQPGARVTIAFDDAPDDSHTGVL